MLNSWKVEKRVLAMVLVLLLLLVSACGKGGGSGKSTDEANGGSSQTKTEGTSKSGGSTGQSDGAKQAENTDPLGKYEPQIELTTGRVVEDVGWKYDEGTSIDKNKWYDLYESTLGIKVKNQWVVNGSEAGMNKINVSIASGDIPDLLYVDATQLKNLVDADMVEDLAGVYDKYASELTKKIMTSDDGYGLKSATFDGKLYALPEMASAVDGVMQVWIRTDWMQKLNLPEPKTIDDIIAIAKAFVENDPDGNNKKDTYGFGIQKEPNADGVPSLYGFFNGFHAYPKIWVKGADGKLAYGSIQPEMKAALAKLAEMYKAGLIDKEFGVKDTPKIGEAIAAGKLGLFYGPMWSPFWALTDNKKNDPKAEWKPFPLPSADDKPTLAQIPFAVNHYYVVKKGYAHPEAAVKLLNLWVDKSYGPNSDQTYMKNAESGIEYFKYAIVKSSTATQNLDAYRAVSAALQSGDTSKLDLAQKGYYDQIEKWKADPSDVQGWSTNLIFGEPSSYQVIDSFMNNKQLMPTQFFGAPTPSMAEKSVSLQKMEVEMTTKIILGSAGLDEFDKFVANWRKLGGDQMTAEVNEWAAKK